MWHVVMLPYTALLVLPFFFSLSHQWEGTVQRFSDSKCKNKVGDAYQVNDNDKKSTDCFEIGDAGYYKVTGEANDGIILKGVTQDAKKCDSRANSCNMSFLNQCGWVYGNYGKYGRIQVVPTGTDCGSS